jgi:Pumilio-family RNA binding repeat
MSLRSALKKQMNALEENMSKNLSPLISWLVIIIFFHKFLGLIRNSYGNYVVQRALNVASGEYKEKLLKAISMRLPEVSDRKIRNKWEQITKEHLTGCTSSKSQQDSFERLSISSYNELINYEEIEPNIKKPNNQRM